MNKLLVIILFISSITVTFSQENNNNNNNNNNNKYKDYIVSNEGDTIPGQVQFRWDYQTCYALFKNDTMYKGKIKKLKSSKIKAFYLKEGDKAYISSKNYFLEQRVSGYYNVYTTVIGGYEDDNIIDKYGNIISGSSYGVPIYKIAIQHGTDDVIPMTAFGWKGTLVNAIADHEELSVKVDAMTVVKVRTSTSAQSAYEQEMEMDFHKIPLIIEEYNDWKNFDMR